MIDRIVEAFREHELLANAMPVVVLVAGYVLMKI